MKSYPPTYERLAESYYQAFSDLQSYRSKWESRFIWWLLAWLMLYVVIANSLFIVSWSIHFVFLLSLASACVGIFWQRVRLARRVNLALELCQCSVRAIEDYQARQWLSPPAAVDLFGDFIHYLGNDIRSHFLSLNIPLHEKIKLSVTDIEQRVAHRQSGRLSQPEKPRLLIHDNDPIRGAVLSQLGYVIRSITRFPYRSCETHLSEDCQLIKTLLSLPKGTLIWKDSLRAERKLHVVDLLPIMLQQDYGAALVNVLGDTHYRKKLFDPSTRARIHTRIIEPHLSVPSL